MTLNNIDNIFKLNFLGRRRARLAGITESRDSEGAPSLAEIP